MVGSEIGMIFQLQARLGGKEEVMQLHPERCRWCHFAVNAITLYVNIVCVAHKRRGIVIGFMRRSEILPVVVFLGVV